MTKLEYLFVIYMYDNGRTIYLIMGGLGEWAFVGGGNLREPQGPPNSRYVVAINENRPDGRPRHQDIVAVVRVQAVQMRGVHVGLGLILVRLDDQRNFVVRAVLCVVHHVLCKANCRGVKDVEATRGALPVT